MVFFQKNYCRRECESAVKIGDDFLSAHIFYKIASNRRKGLSLQGLLIALAFGERGRWIHKTWLIYQQTNTAHLIAISGLHIGLAMGMAFLCSIIATRTAYTLYFAMVSALLWCIDCFRLRLFSRI
ncbi:MAG: ComEC/Rec2 family competence protein [Haemophilus parainfluenzae]